MLRHNKKTSRQGYSHAYTENPFDPARMEQFRAAEREGRESKCGSGDSSSGVRPRGYTQKGCVQPHEATAEIVRTNGSA